MRIALTLAIALAFLSPAQPIDPPPEAMKLIEVFKAEEKAAKEKLEAEIAALKAKAAKETEDRKKSLVVELEKVRAALEAAEKHNEARAVAARIRSIQSPPIRALPDPGNMTAYVAQIDKSFIFRVTGRTEGSSVWGTDLYTSDSDLARAAVHAGVVTAGETKLIKVTVVSTVGMTFTGATRNGVASAPYGPWTAGYRLEGVTTEEAEGVIEAEDPDAMAIEGAAPGVSPPPGSSPGGGIPGGSGSIEVFRSRSLLPAPK